MNKNLVFFILACSLFVLSIISINLAPIINNGGEDDFFEEWGTKNCVKMDDDFKYRKENNYYINQKPQEDQEKRKIDDCKRHKVMHGLEYAALIADVCLGFLCTLLGLIHFVEPGKPLEKYSGFIGLLSGIITLVLTIIYVAFSAVIFNNEPIDTKRLYPNKAIVKKVGTKYVYNYDTEKAKEDFDIPFIKYKDLGKKEYNYDSELFKESKIQQSEFSNCEKNLDDFSLDEIQFYSTDGDKECEYIWDSNYYENESTHNKYIYDRWLTTIIFSVLIAVCGIGLAIFGFLLSKTEGESGATPLQQ